MSQSRETRGSSLTTGTAFGVCFGTASGLLFDNLALGIGPGVALGAGLGYAYDLYKRDKTDTTHD